MLYKITSTWDSGAGGELLVIAGTSNEPTLLRPCANGSLAIEVDTGRMLLRRNASWEEISSGVNMRAGSVSLNAGQTVAVVFSRAFRNAPIVTATAQFQNADVSCTYSCSSITRNGFNLTGAGNPVGVVGWIAVEV